MLSIPSFTRIEVRVSNDAELELAVKELHALADKLATIRGQSHEPAQSAILAHHAIRDASKKMRGAE